VLTALLGGALIGLGATAFWLGNGRVAGVSGLVGRVLTGGRGRGEAIAFLAGLVAAGGLLALLRGPVPPLTGDRPLGALLVAGVLVGFGTRLARGCTSGHGVCGLSRLAPRSLVATLVFMAAGAVTVLLLAQLAPGAAMRVGGG
jgi:uncharacterized membrane protein YedE/YeeE